MAKTTRNFPVRLEIFPVTRDPTWDLIFYYFDTIILNWGYFKFLFFPSPCFRMLTTAFPAFFTNKFKGLTKKKTVGGILVHFAPGDRAASSLGEGV